MGSALKMDSEHQRSLMASRASAMVVVMVTLVASKLKRAREEEDVEPIVYGPRLEADEHRAKVLRKIYNSTDSECIVMLRMGRAPFSSLCNLFRQRGLILDSYNVSVEEQVAMFLHVVGHNQRFRVVHNTFRRSIETVSRHFHQVLYAIGELRSELIKPPTGQTHPKILGNHRWNPFFKNCIGAIDGTHILERIPRSSQGPFRGRKGCTQNVMATVNFDLKFTYVLAGWEGSAHDALILADVIEREGGLSVPEGKMYLVDAGYACRPGFLPPYRGVRYHLVLYSYRNSIPCNPPPSLPLSQSAVAGSVKK